LILGKDIDTDEPLSRVEFRKKMKGKKDDDAGEKQENPASDGTGQDGEAVPMSTNQIMDILASQVESPLVEVEEEEGKEKEGDGKKKKKSTSTISQPNGEKGGKKKGKLQTSQS